MAFIPALATTSPLEVGTRTGFQSYRKAPPHALRPTASRRPRFAVRNAEKSDSTPIESDQMSLFDRLGGQPALDATLEVFYGRMVEDPELEKYFAGVDIRRLKGHQRLFLTWAFTGGQRGKRYTAADMSRVHQRIINDLGCDEVAFDLVAGHLVASLAGLGVAENLIGEVVSLLAPFRPVFERAEPVSAGSA